MTAGIYTGDDTVGEDHQGSSTLVEMRGELFDQFDVKSIRAQ